MPSRSFFPCRAAFFAALVVLSGHAAAQQAAPLPQPLDGLITAGTSIKKDAASPNMAYLVWSAPGPVQPANATIAIYLQANGTGPFVRQGVVSPVKDEPTVKLLMGRATLLNADPVRLTDSINELLNVWQPRATNIRADKTLDPALAALPLSNKIARVLQRGSEFSEAGLALRQMSTAQPILRMALGQAWAGPIPAGAASVFELRRSDPATGEDSTVLGRVTLTPGSGVALTTPGPAVQVPDLTPTGDLNIKLRWSIPDALRRQLHHTTGFLLFRVTKAVGEGLLPANPTLAQLQSLAASNPAINFRPSTAPIIASSLLTAAAAADFSSTGDVTSYFFSDRDSTFTDGAQFYYYVTALDLLGRESAPAPRVLATVIRTIPPDVPSDLTATDEVVTSGATIGQRRIVLRWTANDNAAAGLNGRTAQRYAIYRGATTDALSNPLALESLEDPAKLALLTPIFIAHAPVSGRMTWVDDGLLPTVPDGAKTRWYAVRAVHDTTLGPVLSAPSPPAFAAFRDRTGLPAPTGFVQIDSPLYGTRFLSTSTVPRPLTPGEASGTTSASYLRLSCNRRDPSVEAVSFAVNDTLGNTVTYGPIKFGPGTDNISFDVTIYSARGTISCRSVDVNGCLSTLSTTAQFDFGGSSALRTVVLFESGKWSARQLNPDNVDDARFLTAVPLSSLSNLGNNVATGTLGSAINGRSVLMQRRNNSPTVTSWFTTAVTQPAGTSVTFYSTTLATGTVEFRAYALPVPSPDCPVVHVAHPAGKPQTSPISVIALFPAGTKEWRIYKQVDSGPMELHLHGTSTIPSADTLEVASQDTILPPQGAVLRYFLQCFEENGNPSPLVLIRTVTLLPDPGQPILEAPSSAANGDMVVRWFCPRAGVKNFRLWLAAKMTGVAPPTASGLTVTPAAGSISFRRPGAEQDENAWAIAFCDFPDLTTASTDTVFSQNFAVLPNQEYIVWVEAIGLKAATKAESDRRLFTWKVPIDGTVAWPARPLPPVSTYTGSAVYLPSILPATADPRSSVTEETTETYPVGIRIGTLLFPRAQSAGSSFFAFEPSSIGNSPASYLMPILTASGAKSPLPAVIYRQTILPNGNPGNLIQTTPLREAIVWQNGTADFDNNNATPETAATVMDDPYLRVFVRENGTTDIGELYLVDSQPVELGATYHYYLVRYRSTTEAAPGEIDTVLDCGQITIPDDL